MKLDCDPTTIYAALLEDRYRGTIYRSDLENNNPVQHLPARWASARPHRQSGTGVHSGGPEPGRYQRASISCCAPTVRGGTSFPRRWPSIALRPAIIAVPTQDKSVKRRLREWLNAERRQAITAAVWHSLLKELAPVSQSNLRDLLRDTGLPFEQPYAGVRQHTFEELEQSLGEMLAVYTDALASGDRERARYARRQVIAAKDRARFQARNPRLTPEKRIKKEEMAQWMLVWLENPEVFPAWAEARKKTPIKTGEEGIPNPL